MASTRKLRSGDVVQADPDRQGPFKRARTEAPAQHRVELVPVVPAAPTSLPEALMAIAQLKDKLDQTLAALDQLQRTQQKAESRWAIGFKEERGRYERLEERVEMLEMLLEVGRSQTSPGRPKVDKVVMAVRRKQEMPPKDEVEDIELAAISHEGEDDVVEMEEAAEEERDEEEEREVERASARGRVDPHGHHDQGGSPDHSAVPDEDGLLPTIIAVPTGVSTLPVPAVISSTAADWKYIENDPIFGIFPITYHPHWRFYRCQECDQPVRDLSAHFTSAIPHLGTRRAHLHRLEAILAKYPEDDPYDHLPLTISARRPYPVHIPGIPTQDGWSCDLCPYFMPTQRALRTHMNVKHGLYGSQAGRDYRHPYSACSSLQRFFNINAPEAPWFPSTAPAIPPSSLAAISTIPPSAPRLRRIPSSSQDSADTIVAQRPIGGRTKRRISSFDADEQSDPRTGEQAGLSAGESAKCLAVESGMEEWEQLSSSWIERHIANLPKGEQYDSEVEEEVEG